MLIGVDNGLSGALAAISRHAGQYIAGLPMPTLKRGKFSEIDGRAVVDWIKSIQGQAATIAIEVCPEHANQASIMRSMATSYGILIGAITTGLPGVEIVLVKSGNSKESWQTQMLGRLKKGETKPAALALARQLWPDETWILPGCRTPHMGLIDAALVAGFVRGKLK